MGGLRMVEVFVETKDDGDVKDRFRRECGYKYMPENRIEDYIKSNMGIER